MSACQYFTGYSSDIYPICPVSRSGIFQLQGIVFAWIYAFRRRRKRNLTISSKNGIPMIPPITDPIAPVGACETRRKSE